MTNILFSEAGKLPVAGNKQARRFLSSYPSGKALSPEDGEEKDTSLSHTSMLFVYGSRSPLC